MNSLQKITFYPMLDFKSNLEKNGFTESELLESYGEWHAQAVLNGLDINVSQKGGGIQALLVAILLMTGAVANPNPRPEYTLIPVQTRTPWQTVQATPKPPVRTILATTVEYTPEAASFETITPTITPSPTIVPYNTSVSNTTLYPTPTFIKPPTPSQSHKVTPNSRHNKEPTYGFVSPSPSATPSATPSSTDPKMYEAIYEMAGGILVGAALAGKAIKKLWNFNKQNTNTNSIEMSEEDVLIDELRAELAKKESEIKESAKIILQLTSMIRSKSCKSGGGTVSDEMINTIIKITGGPHRSAEIVKNTLISKQGGYKRHTRRRSRKN